jgi:hypothetical protein
MRLAIAVALGGLLFGIASAVQASIPDSSGVIHGCYGKPGTPQTGQLRVIDTTQGASCRYYENPLNWNQNLANAFSTGDGTGGRLNVAGYVTVQSLNVPAGKYAVTSTAEIFNATTSPSHVDCRLTDSGGTFGANGTYAPAGPSEVMALQGTTSASTADTINLQCQAVVPGFAFLVQHTSIDATQVAAINGS